MGKQFALHVTIQVAPRDVEAFLEALRPCWAGCASEEENLFFDVFQDPKTPGLFRFVEVWSKDEKWFNEVQFKKPYYKPYLDKTVPMWIADRKLLSFLMHVEERADSDKGKMHFMERLPGWSVYSEEYLDEGRKTR